MNRLSAIGLIVLCLGCGKTLDDGDKTTDKDTTTKPEGNGNGNEGGTTPGPGILKGPTYINPVLRPGADAAADLTTLADPACLKDSDGTYYLYVTSPGYPCFSSKNLYEWKYEGKVFENPGTEKTHVKWAKKNFWAPEVLKFNGKYYLNYTASKNANTPKRIGMAVSDSPTGPFVDVADTAFFTHSEAQGSIDSHIFIDDDGRAYMYYSKAMSENFVPEIGTNRSEICVVELAKDLSKAITEPIVIAYPEQSWEFMPDRQYYWNEGAVMLKHDSKYYLMYSANNYTRSEYAVGYAVSDSPTGPFVKYEQNPVLTSKGLEKYVSGTGHHCVVESPDGTELFCIYHSHADLTEKGSKRMINIDRMEFREDGTIFIDGPTTSRQKAPSGVEKE